MELSNNNINGGITLTFGDCAENHVGMQKIGVKELNGFSLLNIKEIVEKFPNKEIKKYSLHHSINDSNNKAYVYIIKNVFPDHIELYNELKNLNWDTKAYMYGRVVNKHARYNLCFADFNQEPDYENGKGRIIKINDVPGLKKINDTISVLPNCNNLKVEGNYYYDIDKCGIGFHGDSERKKVIGVRLGASYPIVYQWYHKKEPISEIINIPIDSGDIYIMSEKAVGTDWKSSSIKTLRHAAGSSKFIN